MSIAQGIIVLIGLILIRFDAHLFWGELCWQSFALYGAGTGLVIWAVIGTGLPS